MADALTTAVDALMGGVGGAVLRLAPEVIKLLDRKNERAHELALQELQIQLTKAQGEAQAHVAEISADTTAATAWLEAAKNYMSGQFRPSGVAWVDALSSTVRPVWTYWVLLTWASVKCVDVWLLMSNNLPWATVRPYIWGPDDALMLSGLTTFWFLDRTFNRAGK